MSTINGTKLLTNKDRDKLINFNKLSYADKSKLKESNPTKYEYLIYLREQDAENKKVISHFQYRKSTSIYNKRLIKSINPAFFITIKYIDNVAVSHERAQHLFEGIRYELTKDRPYKLIHYIEQGQDKSFHSHIFLSSLKGKHKPNQIVWLSARLEEYAQTNRFSIANGSDDNPSILVELFDQEVLNIPKEKRSHYVNKTSNRNYLSLDINNSYITPC